MINNPKLAIAIIVIGVIILFIAIPVIVVLINNALTNCKPVVEKHYYNITDPAHKAEVSDDNLHDQLEEMLQNALDRISKLEEDRQNQGTISELQGRVNQLENDTTALEAGKASQNEVNQLSITIAELNDSTSIANSRAWTTEFRHLSERVDDIDNTTVKISEFFAVIMKVTTLEDDIEQLNITLAMKANQHDINEITDMITSLRETTVRRDEFQGLSDDVETLQTSKADQSDLDDLDDTVTHLGRTAATKTELTSLDGRVANHITSSRNEHNRLSSSINDNDQDIQNHEHRIHELESGGSTSLPMITVVAMTIIIPLYMK